VGAARAIIPRWPASTRARSSTAAPRLKLIVQFGAASRRGPRGGEARGIPVRNVAGANAQAVAELALFLMLALARRLPEHARVLREPDRGRSLWARAARQDRSGIVGLARPGRAWRAWRGASACA
jgi:phosphoglycerate dehydrogenase-like enzyme